MSDGAQEKKKKKVGFSTAWRESRALIVTHKRSLAIGMSLMLVSRLAGLVMPASTKIFVDSVIGQRRADLLVPIALAIGVATLLQAATSFVLSQVVSITAQLAITDMRKRVQAHVTRLPVSYFDSTQTGILISRIMTDAEGIRNLVGTGLVQLVGGLVTATLALFVLFYLNWKLTSVTLLLLLSFGSVMTIAFRRLRPVFRERSVINAEVTGRLAESMGGIRIVKTYTAERRENLVFARGAHRLFRNVARTITGISTVGAFSTLIIGMVGIVMILGAGRAVLAGRMTLGDVVTYVVFVGMLAMPLIEISSIGTQVSEAFAGLDRIREILSMSTEDQEDAGRMPLVDIDGDVRFEDVSFEYNAGVPVLKKIDLHAPAGTTTALVGSSGSGKSTLISLVMAFNRPQAGRVLVDGHDLARVRLRDFRSHLGVVLQDNFLFDGSIADNIRFSKPGASIDDVREAAHVAHCEEFIDGFKDGYETIVGERGVKLSGGQRQRVAIARAILADPRILILDEATSSLDSESEGLIRDGLRSLRHGRTTFVIAHRLSTIASADQILVLEHGEIVERGRQEELLALGGRYRELYDKQYGLEHDTFINPGEDFTPDLPKVAAAIPVRAAQTL